MNSTNSVNHYNGLVTKGSTHLARNTLSLVVIPREISITTSCLIHVLPLTTLNKYWISGNFFFTTAWRNISVVRYEMSLVTILILDLVKIHWIQWIQWKPFAENSIVICVVLYNLICVWPSYFNKFNTPHSQGNFKVSGSSLIIIFCQEH